LHFCKEFVFPKYLKLFTYFSIIIKLPPTILKKMYFQEYLIKFSLSHFHGKNERNFSPKTKLIGNSGLIQVESGIVKK